MHTIIRREGKISTGVGWMLTVMAVLAFITVIVLTFVIDTWLLYLLFAPVILLIGAGVNFWMGARARLEITPEEFIWCGFVGSARRIAWRDLDRILIPAPGSRRRLAAAARLKDGSIVEIDAKWISPTSPANLLSVPNHSEAQRALVNGHKAFLSQFPR
jgi:hypothetical protein